MEAGVGVGRVNTIETKGLNECLRVRHMHKVGVNRSSCGEGHPAFYVELSGYHGSTGKGQLSTKAFFSFMCLIQTAEKRKLKIKKHKIKTP